MPRMAPLPCVAGEDIVGARRYPPPWSKAEWGRRAARSAMERAGPAMSRIPAALRMA
jgi:hypothetical protein